MDENQNACCEFSQHLMSVLSERLTTNDDLKLFVDNLVAAFASQPSERYSDNFFFDIIKPTVIALIRFKDDTAKELRYLNDFITDNGCTNHGTDYAVEILEGVLRGIDDILLGYDVQPFRCEGVNFNPRRQNVVKKITAEKPEQVKTVAESLSDGYERNGIVVSKERVSAYAAEANTKGEA